MRGGRVLHCASCFCTFAGDAPTGAPASLRPTAQRPASQRPAAAAAPTETPALPAPSQAVIHCEVVRQSATVVSMDRDRLRSGDKARVRFRFLQHPEYLSPGARFVFREGRTRGVGVVAGPGADVVPASA